MTKIKTLDEVVAQMKQEVLADINAKIVPVDVSSFGELHDYVDANCYGGFCEDNGMLDALIAHHGGRDSVHEGMPDAVFNFINTAQGSINKWVLSGEILKDTTWTSDLDGLKLIASAIRAEKSQQRSEEHRIMNAMRDSLA